jgi:hypothetical protein
MGGLFLLVAALLSVPFLCFLAAYYPDFEDPSPLVLAVLVASEVGGFFLGIAAMTCLYLWWLPLEKR